MVDNGRTLTTGEFSQTTGIAVSTITKMLRQGRIRGEKRGGKWAIYKDELQNTAVVTKTVQDKSSASPGPLFDTPPPSEKAYDVETFAQLTYLTEKGIRRWLKAGRLSGSTGTGGRVRVNAANLERAEFQHLVRK